MGNVTQICSCEKGRPSIVKHTVLGHGRCDRPLQELTSDIFQSGIYEYLVVTDYYGGGKTTNRVIYKLQPIFSRFGFPESRNINF